MQKKKKSKIGDFDHIDQTITVNKKKWKQRIVISTPTEGWIRFEWAYARFSQIIPINWQATGFDINLGVSGYNVADAYNVIVKKAIELDAEWLLIIEDDVLIPADFVDRMNDYILDGSIPIVSGLYYAKTEPAEPLLFRGRGNGCYQNWKLGQKVWVDGVPMGALLIHMAILRYFWNNKKRYKLPDGVDAVQVFETPRKVFFDPQMNGFSTQRGTQDLYFCDEVLKNKVLKNAGFPEIGRKKYPFLVDTSILCKHIDRQTGKQYPS